MTRDESYFSKIAGTTVTIVRRPKGKPNKYYKSRMVLNKDGTITIYQ